MNVDIDKIMDLIMRTSVGKKPEEIREITYHCNKQGRIDFDNAVKEKSKLVSWLKEDSQENIEKNKHHTVNNIVIEINEDEDFNVPLLQINIYRT